jgi:hypothetical protein
MTIREQVAAEPAIPDPPPGATHALVHEPYGPARSWWALVKLDSPPDADAAILDGLAGFTAADLAPGVAALLGCPVVLSARIEADGEFAYYVTPAPC